MGKSIIVLIFVHTAIQVNRDEMKNDETFVRKDWSKMERVLIKYRATLFGNDKDKKSAVKVMEKVFPGTEIYELIERDVYGLTRDGGFTEDDMKKMADVIAEAVPELPFFLDIMHYDTETTAKLIKVRFNYAPGSLRVHHDLI